MTNATQKDWEALTAPISFRQALDILSSLHKLRHPRATASAVEFERLRKRAQDSETMRNEVVHSWWVTSKESGELMQVRITARAGRGVRENLAEGRDISSIENLSQIAENIREVNKELSRFLELSRATKIHFDNPP